MKVTSDPLVRAKRAEAMRKWRSHNPEHSKSYMAQWRADNADHLKEYSRRTYQENKEEQKEYATKWQKDHPERTRLQWKVPKANRRYPGTISIDDVIAVVEKYGRVCCWCGKANLSDRDLTLEHLKPFNSRECLAIACHSCNSKKLQRENKGPSPEAIERRKSYARQWRRDNPDLAKARDKKRNDNRGLMRLDAALKRKGLLA